MTGTRSFRLKLQSLLFAGPLFLLGACGQQDRLKQRGDSGAADVPSTVVRRDSSGVAIIENTSPSSGAVRQWAVDTIPSLVLGGGQKTGPYEFTAIRFVFRNPTGRIVVFDAATQELRFFDSTGKHVKSLGKAGKGPGEFESVIQVRALRGDTVELYDESQRRITVMSETGGVVKTIPVLVPEMRTMLSDTMASVTAPLWVSDSAVIMRGFRQVMEAGEAAFSHDVYQYLDLSTKSARKVAEHGRPAGTLVTISDGSTRRITAMQTEYSQLIVEPGGKMACAAMPRYARLECVNANGNLMQIRWVFDTIPFPATRRAEMLDSALRKLGPTPQPSRKADVEMFYAKREWPPFWFPVIRFGIDTESNIWVREHAPYVNSMETRRHRVFSSRGEHIAFASDFSFTPFSIGSDEVIGVFRDADDVQHVGVYRIRKG